ncbi:nitrate ABC transporter substrate-binding protein, partial [Rhodococcus erythropolis]
MYSNRKVHPNRRSVGAAGAALAMCAAIGLTACSSSEAETTKAESLESAAEAQNLAGLCPENVVVQLQWQPQSDMGALFEMLGPGYSV